MQTLLFCKDEKSANVLIQLVQKLEVGVKHETEVISAISSLKAEHFDFLIIDVEDVQTTRSLLNTARGSAMNKNALIVAIGVPETGAGAFRLGAEFLIPKPITPGQAEPIFRRVRAAILRGQNLRTEDETTSTPGTPSQLRQQAVLPPEVGGSPGLATKAVAAAAGRGGDGANAAIANRESDSATSKITVDPIKEKEAWGSKGRCFSETDEMPLKEEDQIASLHTPAPAATTEVLSSLSTASFQSAGEPYITPRQVTNNAVTEIKKSPAKRWVVSIMAAGTVVLLITTVIAWRIRSKDSLRDQGAPVHSSTVVVNTPSTAEVSSSQSTVPETSIAPEAVAAAPVTADLPATTPVTSAVAPEELPANLPSNPVKVDAQVKSVGAKPHSLSRKPKVPRTVVSTKLGHAAKVRAITGSSRNDTSSVSPVPLTAVVLVNSDPAGAAVWMDGVNTRQTTPARISLGKSGKHTFVLMKQGYMEETIAANMEIGQTFQIAPSLRALGHTDQIKTVGKFKKLFGAGDKAGMGMVSVKTQPKGAQIAVNTHVLDKTSPAQFYLNPGSYMIDLTLSGFKSVHRVVSVEKGEKIAIEEVMDRD